MNLLSASSISINPRSSQLGLGMIEILVTLVILAIGLLGVASLQLVASFNNAGTIDLTNNSILSENTMSARHNKCHG